MPRIVRFLVVSAAALSFVLSAGEVRPCTSIMVGGKASTDGSVMTSHTCDSHRTGSDILVVPRTKHAPGRRSATEQAVDDDAGPMPRYGRTPTGRIPQVARDLRLPGPGLCGHERASVGHRRIDLRRPEGMLSDKGLIDCETLTRLMLERATTAREAIRVAGELIEEYGWCDVGEALTIADTKEVWLMEIVGPGKDEVGAVWAAQRVPDDHVSVVANAARIGEIDLSKPDWFMASDNVGNWPRSAAIGIRRAASRSASTRPTIPTAARKFASTRREWRALTCWRRRWACQPNGNVFPFSVKPEQPVGPEKDHGNLPRHVRGHRVRHGQGPHGGRRDGQDGEEPAGQSVHALRHEQDAADQRRLGLERRAAMARWYCMYATVTQSRGWLPDAVGGIVWFGYGNPAMTTYVPLYAGITDLPEDYKTDGRTTGFSRRSAWWAFNRVAKIAAHRWGDMRRDVAGRPRPAAGEVPRRPGRGGRHGRQALRREPGQGPRLPHAQSREACQEANEAYWNLGDLLWTKYDEQW